MNRIEDDVPSRKISTTGPRKILGLKNADGAVSQRNAPTHRKALFSQRPKNNLLESFEMASTNIYTDCKPYTASTAWENGFKKNKQGLLLGSPCIIFYPVVMSCD